MFRGLRRNVWGNEVPPELKQAHRSFETGQYSLAAEKYAVLARDAEKQRSPRAPWLYLQAARSELLLGQGSIALKHLECAVSLLISGGFDDKAHLIGQQARAQLHAMGWEDEAEELAQFLRFGLAGYSVATVPQPGSVPQVLPTRCPNCEGPIRTIEVRWKDARTAECPYCGNPVQVLLKVRQ